MKARIQQVGAFLAGMVLPNIGAFIAWGFLTALFIPSGWIPNEHLARLVSPTVLNLLPILIGFAGGRLIYGIRGGVVGAVGTMGVVAGSDIPMFIGAMIMGPLGGWTIRWFDRIVKRAIPVGFEMLAANFSAGILGLALMLLAFTLVGSAVQAVTAALGAGARWVTRAGMLPLIALLIEPGKVLFVNNAINHGILAPLGVAEVKEAGKSIFFLLESNPGPGLGLLLAYWLCGKGTAKASSPGAILIQFFGGIHELYFPYVLMNPLTLLAVVAGGLSADTVFVLTGAGLVATPSPGSVFAQIAMAPRGGLFPVLSGILAGALASLAVAIPIVRRTRTDEIDGDNLAKATETMITSKAEARISLRSAAIYFVCEAGMGSSVMGASILRGKLKQAGIQREVRHSALSELPASAGIVVLHRSLSIRAAEMAPDARIYAVDEFIQTPVYDRLIDDLAGAAR
jgi:mannitol PTS system EIICBA or EIICB component